jgi:site-specific DNA recombinase
MQKAVIYARVSSKEQEDTGYSLDAQVNLLKEYADRHQIKIERIFRISESASGKQIRKTFTEMLAYVTKKNITIVLCEKIDRLTRNLRDAAIVSDWLTENDGRAVHFVKENFIVNRNTRAHENLVWDMKVAIARFYTNNLSEEVKKGQAQKLKEGGYPSRPILGYKTVGDKGRKQHVVDENFAPFIRRLFQLYASGLHSLKTVTAVMHNEGLRNFSGKKVHRSRIAQLLNNPFYRGDIFWNKKLHPGSHEPLVSKEMYNKVQSLLHSKNTPKHRKHTHLFKQMGQCGGCKGTATGEIQKGHVYYHCNGYRECDNRKFIREEVIEDKLSEVFTYLAKGVSDEEFEIIREVLHEDHREEVEYLDKAIRSLDTQHKLLQQRIERAYTDKLDGNKSTEEWQKLDKAWREEQQAISDQKSRLQQNNAHYMLLGVSFVDLAHRAKEIYEGLGDNVEAKREFLKLTVSNFVLNTEKVQLFFTKPIEVIKNRFEQAKSFELTKNPSINGAFSVLNNQGHEPIVPSVKNNFEPKEVLILPNDLSVEPSNHEVCSAARTRTWNHLLNREPLYH